MAFMEFNIGKNQAEEFAKAIFVDIESYVNEHLEEYEEFLKEYESEVKKMAKLKRLVNIKLLENKERGLVL